MFKWFWVFIPGEGGNCFIQRADVNMERALLSFVLMVFLCLFFAYICSAYPLSFGCSLPREVNSKRTPQNTESTVCYWWEPAVKTSACKHLLTYLFLLFRFGFWIFFVVLLFARNGCESSCVGDMKSSGQNGSAQSRKQTHLIAHPCLYAYVELNFCLNFLFLNYSLAAKVNFSCSGWRIFPVLFLQFL